MGVVKQQLEKERRANLAARQAGGGKGKGKSSFGAKGGIGSKGGKGKGKKGDGKKGDGKKGDGKGKGKGKSDNASPNRTWKPGG